MFNRLTGLTVLLAASLTALPACGKKTPPATQPDSTPTPAPNDGGSKKGPPGGVPNQNPNPGTNTQSDPSLPTRPHTPMFTAINPQARDGSLNNLKQIALAFHNAHDTTGSFPVGIADKSGKLGLSWRVAILPYIEQDGLYKMFKLDEPWDSPDNKKLIPMMPAVYGLPRVSTNGYTFYRSFSGPGAFLPPAQPGRPGQLMSGLKITSIPDGTSNTLMVAEAAEPVIWTKPDDLPFSPGKPPKLGNGVFSNGICAVFCDGSTQFLPVGLPNATLSNLIQTNDGTPIDRGDLR